MKILFAADGSKYTKKALAFLVTHEGLAQDAQVVVVNVQPPMPPRVTAMVGAHTVADYHREEAAKVVDPIVKFLDRHGIAHKEVTLVGRPGQEILRVAKKEKVAMIVMGTHGHGIIGRALMGSVAQNVVTDCEVPVLLVK